MIEYTDIVSKRVVLVVLDEAEPDTATLIPGVADLDEANYMFQIFPDEEVTEDWEEGECVGIGCETFENDIITRLEKDHIFRKRFDCEYMIILR